MNWFLIILLTIIVILSIVATVATIADTIAGRMVTGTKLQFWCCILPPINGLILLAGGILVMIGGAWEEILKTPQYFKKLVALKNQFIEGYRTIGMP